MENRLIKNTSQSKEALTEITLKMQCPALEENVYVYETKGDRDRKTNKTGGSLVMEKACKRYGPRTHGTQHLQSTVNMGNKQSAVIPLGF